MPSRRQRTSRRLQPIRKASDVIRFLECPSCGGALAQADGFDAPQFGLRCTSCARAWEVCDGLPDLTFPDELRRQEANARAFWNRIAPLYDFINLFTGWLRGVSVRTERRQLIRRLGLAPGSAVLEVAAGSGSNLRLLAEEVGEQGIVFGLDLSPRMLGFARRRMRDLPVPLQLVLGSSQRLPFTKGVFDAVLDGAGIKYHPDKGRALREMLRVVKPGGRVLVTELGMPAGVERPSLRQRALLLWIPGFHEAPPVADVPSESLDVRLDWDSAETFYALEFRKPPAQRVTG